MDCHVDSARQHRALDFLGENALSTNLHQGAVLELISCRLDFNDLHRARSSQRSK
jgi:hypothetical protein